MSDDMKVLSAEDILNHTGFKQVVVPVPEWRGSVILQELDAAEALKFSSSKNDATSMVRLLALSAVDEAGQRLFTSKDVEKLSKKSFGVVSRLQDAAMELNGLRTPRVQLTEGLVGQLLVQLDSLVVKGSADVEELKALRAMLDPVSADDDAKND
jgi:hypothetical protein